jgi:PAS domain S-box-containing protein
MPLFPVRLKFRLRTTLVVPLVLQIVASAGLVGYLFFVNEQKVIDNLATQLCNQVSKRIIQQLSRYLAIPRETNEVNLELIKLEMLNPEDIETTARFFWKQMKLAENLSYLNFGSQRGTFIGIGREDDGSLYRETKQPSDGDRYQRYALDQQGNPTKLLASEIYRFQEDEWYQSAVKAGKPIWSPIYQWADRPEIISISSSYPVYDSSKQLIGVLGVDFILSHISNFLRDLQISPSGQIFIIEPDGMIVASSSPEKSYQNIDGKAQRLNIFQSQEALIQETAEQLSDRFSNLDQISSPQMLSLQINNEQTFVSVTPWQDNLGLNWLVVLVIPKSDFMDQINVNTRNTILLCLTALGLAIISSVFTARRINRLIQEISQASIDIVEGNIEQNIKTTTNLVEIDQLAHSFNRMMGKMNDSFKALRSSEEKFRGLVANIPGAIYRCKYDPNWTMEYVSNAIETISGYPASDFIQSQVRTYASIIHPDDCDLVEVIINHSVVIQEPYILEYQILHQDGSIRWVYEQGRVIFDPDDNPLYLDGAIFDMTERKESEEALRVAEENYRRIFQKNLEEKLKFEYLQKELDAASTIQTSILPHQFPLFPNHPQADVAATIIPAKEVGGDFFDAFPLDENLICIALGDVSGKGIPAALFMIRVITLIRLSVSKLNSLASIVESINRHLCEGNDNYMFVTMFIGVFDVTSGKLTYVNGGHNLPFFARRGNPFQLLEVPKGILLGIHEGATYETAELLFQPGDTLVLYTDGVTEAENQEQEFFSTERTGQVLNNVLTTATSEVMVKTLQEAVFAFSHSVPQSDDVTILVLRYILPQ